MKLLSKLTLTLSVVMAVIKLADPMPVSAQTASSATAAAVSIKFQESSVGNGFSLNPNGSATGNVNGVQDISAAIATGETRATATTGIGTNGTNASSEGYSQPVTFKFNTPGSEINATNIVNSYEYTGSTAGLSVIPVAR